MRTAFSVLALMGIMSSAHAAVDLDAALSKVRASCGGISEELNTMRAMAGIGTAVSAAGAATGVAAVATGVMKSQTENKISELNQAKIWEEIVATNNNCETVNGVKLCSIDPSTVSDILAKYGVELEGNSISEEGIKTAQQNAYNSLDKKSETLGNIRTGTLAATTAANIAGVAVGGVNMKKARGSLTEQVSE